MPSTATQTDRFALRLPPADKARLQRAAALEGVDLKSFLLRHALIAADAAIERAQRLTLSERDAARLLEVLDGPAEPNDVLLAAAAAYRNHS